MFGQSGYSRAMSDIIKMLAQRSGLSEEEITKQLSQILPGSSISSLHMAACQSWRSCRKRREQRPYQELTGGSKS